MLRVGIDTDICKKLDCEHWTGCVCCIKYCAGEVNPNGRENHCPVPENCPYRNIHIISGEPILVTNGCSKKCKSRAINT